MTGGIGRISAEQFWTEQVRLTPLTSDPADSEEGELWLRADLAEDDDQLATLRLDSGASTVDIPVFDVGADVPVHVSTQLRLVVDGQQGFVPTVEDGGSIPQLGVWSDGVRHGAIEELIGIPDSEADQKLSHRWLLDDVNGTIEDSEGDISGDNVGVTSVDGIYSGGSAGEGDGTDDHINLGNFDNFGVDLGDDFAIGVTVHMDSMDDTQTMMGLSPSDSHRFRCLQGNRNDLGSVEIDIRDGDGDAVQVWSEETYDDNEKHRVIFNKKGSAGSDIEIWVDQTQVNTGVTQDDNPSSFPDWNEDFLLFASSSDGSPSQHFEEILDDVCVFHDSLTQSEIESYDNPWS